MCIILNHEKSSLPIQDILMVNFYIWEHSFQFGGSFCGKNLKFKLQGQIQFQGTIFSLGKLLFLGYFFSLGKFVYGNWEILNIYFKGKFFVFKGILKIYKGAFLIKGLGPKLPNFGVITLKLGVCITHMGIKINIQVQIINIQWYSRKGGKFWLNKNV